MSFLDILSKNDITPFQSFECLDNEEQYYTEQYNVNLPDSECPCKTKYKTSINIQ